MHTCVEIKGWCCVCSLTTLSLYCLRPCISLDWLDWLVSFRDLTVSVSPDRRLYAITPCLKTKQNKHKNHPWVLRIQIQVLTVSQLALYQQSQPPYPSWSPFQYFLKYMFSLLGDASLCPLGVFLHLVFICKPVATWNLFFIKMSILFDSCTIYTLY